MIRQKHTTKKGPGRRHADGTDRGSTRDKVNVPIGNKMAKAAHFHRIGKR